jgi:hypothetical protein
MTGTVYGEQVRLSTGDAAALLVQIQETLTELMRQEI